MKTLLVMLALLIRLLRPTRGVHVSPLGYVRELAGELRRRRARRVRRYAQDLPCLAEDAEPAEEEVPVVPAPRPPVDGTLTAVPRQTSVPGEYSGSAFDAGPVVMLDELVPGYYRAWEFRQKLVGAERPRREPAGWVVPVAGEFRVGVSA